MPACRSWKSQTLQLVGLETLKHEVAVKFTQNYIYICRSLQHMYIYIYCVYIYIYVEVQSQRKQQNLSIEWLLKQKNLTINDRASTITKKNQTTQKKNDIYIRKRWFLSISCALFRNLWSQKNSSSGPQTQAETLEPILWDPFPAVFWNPKWPWWRHGRRLVKRCLSCSEIRKSPIQKGEEEWKLLKLAMFLHQIYHILAYPVMIQETLD